MASVSSLPLDSTAHILPIDSRKCVSDRFSFNSCPSVRGRDNDAVGKTQPIPLQITATATAASRSPSVDVKQHGKLAGIQFKSSRKYAQYSTDSFSCQSHRLSPATTTTIFSSCASQPASQAFIRIYFASKRVYFWTESENNTNRMPKI